MIVTGLDRVPMYVKQCRVMLASLQATNPGQAITVCCANWAGDELQGINSSARIVRVGYLKGDPDLAQRIWMVRFDVTCGERLFAGGHERVAWMDCDTIIRKPLGSEFWDQVAPGRSEFSVWVRPEHGESRRVQAGIWLAASGDYMPRFFRVWKQQATCNKAFLCEQLGLWRTLQICRGVTLVPLKEVYNDIWFTPDGVIWHSRKKGVKYKSWRVEEAMYRKQAEERNSVWRT